jgi:hypothetical protein
MQVDLNNRLVADALEADWNDKLRSLSAAQEQYEQQRQKDRTDLDEVSRQKVLALAQDLPGLWADPRTSDQDRKRMVRLLIEDVTLTKDRQIRVQIRFKGGATRSLVLPMPLRAWQLRKTNPDIVSEVDRLLGTHTEGQIADELNRRGCRSGAGRSFTSRIVSKIRRTYHLTSRRDRLRKAGLLTLTEIAQQLAVDPEQLADASQGAPQVPQEIADGLHAPLLAEEASAGNLPQVLMGRPRPDYSGGTRTEFSGGAGRRRAMPNRPTCTSVGSRTAP